MRVINAIVFTGLLVGLSACGTKNNKQDNSNDQVEPSAQVTEQEKQELETEFNQIPSAAIVRVPVDANGETIGDPEMKTVSNADGLDNADGMAAAFEAGAAPQKMVSGKDELDGDSSTQSWQEWDNYGQQNSECYGNTGSGCGSNCGGGGGGISIGCGNNCGNSGCGSYNPCSNSYGCNNSYQRPCTISGGCGSTWGHSYWYNNYKPVLYSKGYGWNYGYYRPSHYVTKGYRYYCYRPYQYWK